MVDPAKYSNIGIGLVGCNFKVRIEAKYIHDLISFKVILKVILFVLEVEGAWIAWVQWVQILRTVHLILLIFIHKFL